MKPRTPIQQEVARLSERLPKLTAIQRAYAFRHCFKHYAIKRADGTNICTECGHSWKSEHDLADTVCGCTCPDCGMELEALRTRKRVFNENEYFCIITTCKQYQVIRFFFVKSRYKAGQAAEYSIYEVVQRWISPKGTTVTVARLRGMSILYYDLWAEYSDMEVRKNNKLRAYDINPVCTYPRQRFIPELKRNGFNGEYHNILPYDLFTAILSDSRSETLLKAGQYPMLRHYIRSSFDIERYWASVKICIRNGYTIADGSMWRDTIDLLRLFGKDTNCPKYVCPSDLWAEYSDMEVRKNNKLRAYDINPVCTYPRQRFIPELKRNGFNGEYHNILPYDLFTAILSDSRSETLLKAGQYPMLRHYIRSSFDIERYWASVKICIRNGYTIADGSMWRDTIDLLRLFGKDTNSPKYVCPSDLKAEHDRLMHKRNKEIERKKLEERIRQAKKHEKAYRKLKGIFFGIAFTDGTLQVRVLESVAEFAAEGTELHHCVFSNSYFLEKNSLILSATIDGKRIETVEVSLKTLEVVQSRGLHNSNTEYHDRIVNLVNSNVNLIRQRMEAA